MRASDSILQAYNDRAKASGWPFQCVPAGNFEQAGLNQALAVWREKARGRAMPARADMTVRAMKSFLTHVSLLERVPGATGSRYRLRLHGSAQTRYDGDKTGMFLEDIIDAKRIDGYLALYDTVLALGAPLRVVSHYQAPEINYLTGESLLAPLSTPQSGTPLILSVTYARPRIEAEVAAIHALLHGRG